MTAVGGWFKSDLRTVYFRKDSFKSDLHTVELESTIPHDGSLRIRSSPSYEQSTFERTNPTGRQSVDTFKSNLLRTHLSSTQVRRSTFSAMVGKINQVGLETYLSLPSGGIRSQSVATLI